MSGALLLATDGSDHGRKAEVAALRIAKSYAIGVAALYVAYAETDSERERAVKEGEKVLDGVLEEGTRMGVEVQKLLVGVSVNRFGGRPTETIADTILEMAEELRVHTIVMGSEGKKGLKHALLGSVAENIARNARCNVLIVKTD
ncbi:MAG: universal stress protein [Candidatus Hydrothermarchaeota archaeon]